MEYRTNYSVNYSFSGRNLYAYGYDRYLYK